jgi:FKBP-type peptidyl-prolyl cis-trans isomerase SlpA
MIEIGPNTSISLNFALKLESGEIVDSNLGADPVNCSVGDGNLLPGFEKALFGLKAGQKADLHISAEQGFGAYREENLQVFDRDQFADELEVGSVVSFADAARGELPGVIVAIKNSRVEVDFNHPLAGRDLVFQVEIHDVQPQVSH